MHLQQNYVKTSHPGNKDGIMMLKNQYDEIRDFILTTLETEGEITINGLLDLAHQRFGMGVGSPLGLLLYHVKLDLEVKGLITQERKMTRSVKAIIPIIKYHKSANRAA